MLFRTQQVVTIQIDGRNDAAVIAGTSTGTVVEAGGVANAAGGTPTASGTLTDTDVDNAANTFTVAGAERKSRRVNFRHDSGGYGVFTLEKTNAAVEALNVGDTLTDTFTVTTLDCTQQVATSQMDGRLSLHDALPICTGTVVEAGGVANAAGGTPTASGTLTDTDVDNAANTFTVAGAASAQGYGSFTIDAGGAWTYTLDNTNAAVEALNVGDTLTDTFTVTTLDGTQQVVTIQIDGRNDAAVIAGTSTGTVVEAGGVANAAGGTPKAGGAHAGTAVEIRANMLTVAGAASAQGYGSISIDAGGEWTYTLDYENSAVEALIHSFPTDALPILTTLDGTQQVVTIQIDGRNDAAVIAGTSTGTVVEAGGVANAAGGTPTASGTLTDTDVDKDRKSVA